ncbi:MAG: ATP-binding protein [Lachnospiraceae bacterium]|nr:ATP-binding protein [Lachnospiraceae bacterium]
MKKNPYTLLFGKEPKQFISRRYETSTVIENFDADEPTEQLYLITGVRGSGKTVFMTEVSNQFKKDKDWVVVELNSETEILENLVSKLSSENSLAQIFKTAKINLSFWGFGLEVSGVAPITNIEVAITKMLESMKKQNKRLLVTIDEVVSSKSMREFASAYQIFIRQDLPIYLLMTGLFENIDELQNEKNLTFLYRAPRIALKPLNTRSMADNYMNNIDIDDETAMTMAKMTMGYSFAFQVLGHFVWEEKGKYEKVVDEYKKYLGDFVYDKIWSEVSNKDRQVLYGIANTQGGRVKDVREFLGMETNEFNPYRKRLVKKGLIDGDKYGYVSLTLPYFDEFILENY